ncbi:MAG: amidohydrolase family protein [Verrucomicrobiota bacterium]
MREGLIDSHAHFWDPEVLSYRWLDTLPSIDRAYLPADLEAVSGEWGVEGVVFVQADCDPDQGLKEAAMVAEWANDYPWILGIVAFAALEKGPEVVEGDLDSLQAIPLVRGVRRLIQSEGPGFACEDRFVEGVSLLGPRGLTCDLCIRHDQLGDVLELVSRCPEVAFVLDHFGKPAIKDGLLDPWREEMRALAAFPQVRCKFSGLITEGDWVTWKPDDLRPYVEHVLDVFGPDRLMFGGDWPVVTLAGSYGKWVETAQELMGGLSEADQQAIFCDNAKQFYRLEQGLG